MSLSFDTGMELERIQRRFSYPVLQSKMTWIGWGLGSLLWSVLMTPLQAETFVRTDTVVLRIAQNSCETDLSPFSSQSTSMESLEYWLDLRRRYPEQSATIDARIEADFAAPLAILVMDTVGFSSTTARLGIIPALAQIFQIRALTLPVIEQSDGRLLKAEADNVFAVFSSADKALSAAQEILTVLNQEGFQASIGIGHGRVLVVGEHDVFGQEMNLASRLGEDLAQADEILITPSAWSALSERPLAVHLFNSTDGGLEYYQVLD